MGLQGVQLQANFFIDKVGGVVEIGAWRRFCGQGMLSGSRYYVVGLFDPPPSVKGSSML